MSARLAPSAEATMRPAPMVRPDTLLAASQARLLACIVFHFAPAKLGFLFDAVRTLAEYPIAQVDIVIITNDEGAKSPALHDLCCQLSADPARVTLRPAGPLAHPHHLPWEHKAVLRQMLAEAPACHSHFLYLEDDLRFPFVNFCYFLQNRALAAFYGCIPSFVRIEFNPGDCALTATDHQAPFDVGNAPGFTVDGMRFVFMGNPYCGLYLFDRALAAEHLAAPSSDMAASAAVHPWGMRERAAMGQCFEGVRPGLPSRMVVPVDPATLIPLPQAWVHHLPNNYAADQVPGPNYMFGKIRLDALVREAPHG